MINLCLSKRYVIRLTALIIMTGLLMTAGGLLSCEVWAQDREESLTDMQSTKVIHEAFPVRVPMSQATETQSPVARSMGLAGAFQEGINLSTLAPLTAEDIASADREFKKSPCSGGNSGPERLGLVRTIEPVPLSIDNGFSKLAQLQDEGTVWTSAIRSPGAYGIRVHFTQFDVGAGSMIVYADDGQQLTIRGPYSGRGPNRNGDFWTPSLPGDIVYVEVNGILNPQIEIAEFVHFDRDLSGLASSDYTPEEFPCHLDAMCDYSFPINEIAREAVGKMNNVCGDFATGCTGTLLNDLDDETFAPYFLTAYHCLSTQTAVNSMEVVWFWQNDACDSTPPTNYNTLPQNCGGTLLETNPTDGGNDMTFIRLNGGLPGGIGLAGWTTGHPDTAVGIHHPGTGSGSWKRVVFLSDVGFCPGCEFCGDGTDYDYYDQDQGLIEPGSSGSGVFNSAGQLAGQLWGYCCVVPACADGVYNCSEADEYEAQYGEFETTHPIIRRWLEIGGTIHVDGSYVGPEEGTLARPFNTVNEANNFAWDGARIKINAGAYPETLTFSKQLTVLARGGTATIGQ